MHSITASAVVLLAAKVTAARTWPHHHETHWPGWHRITHMFVFGDSYTTTGFNVSGAQPNMHNPLGNPDFPGYTSSNGPNWVDFLTLTYNKTFLETVNLAYGGATVDGALVAPYEPSVLSLKQQVEDEYLAVYSEKPEFFRWRSESTLFASFIGINDIGNSYGNATSSTIYAQIWAEYSGLIDRLYDTGARNFLFLSVPPVDRSPLTKSAGAAAQALEAKEIAAWNRNLTSMATALRKKHPDSTVFLFDIHDLFNRVIDDPCSFPQTCAYSNTSSYCPSYENGTSSWYTFDAECGVPVDEYFWLNSLHPTFRVHNVSAEKIAHMLEDGSMLGSPSHWC